MSNFTFDENIRCLNCRTRFSNSDNCPACGSFNVQSMDGYDFSKEEKKGKIWYTMKIDPENSELKFEFPKESTQNE